MSEIRRINLSKIQPQPLDKKAVESSSPSKSRQINSDALKIYSDAKSAEIKSGMKFADKKALESLVKYNVEIRQKPKRLTLDRNPLFQCDIPYQPDSFYRMIGEGGYQDFLETGTIRAKQGTKQNYPEIYFEKGRANNIYASKGGSQYIVESRSKRIEESEAHYPRTEMLEKAKDTFRIWHRTSNGGYEIVYDTMGDVISRNRDFRYRESPAV